MIAFLNLPKDIHYSIAILLNSNDLISLASCNKQCLKTIHDNQFWYRKLYQDFPLYMDCPPQLDIKTWYWLVQKIIITADAYNLDDLSTETLTLQKFEETAFLMMAAAFHDHCDIINFLYDIDSDILKHLKTLPLTKEIFPFIPKIVEYLQIQYNKY